MTRLRLSELKEIIASQVVDVADLCEFLEIGIEEILERFPDRLKEHQGKFDMTSATDGVYDDDDLTTDELLDELDAEWEDRMIAELDSAEEVSDED